MKRSLLSQPFFILFLIEIVITITAESCTDDCNRNAYCVCVPFQERQGKSQELALQACKDQINAGQGPLSNKGCIADCTLSESYVCEDSTSPNTPNTPTSPTSNQSNVPIELRSTIPTLCTTENMGHCECGNLNTPESNWVNVVTYTWWVKDSQRCVTSYTPSDATGPRPTILEMNCYSGDKLNAVRSKMSYADRFGVNLLFLSNPSRGWSGMAEVCGTATQPQLPCIKSTNEDLLYVDAILTHIIGSDSNANVYDKNNVYTRGFSQNGMFAGYIGVCFGSQKIAGSWVGGAGMYTRLGGSPVPPGKQGTADECRYWPAYPCFNPVNKVKACLQVYSNDNVVVNKENTSQSHVSYMYDAMQLEKHDAISLVFNEDSTQNIPGGHKDPQNKDDWMMGCLGITTICNEACETALINCVGDLIDNGKYSECITQLTPATCPMGCSPTLKMLQSSEQPTIKTAIQSAFGKKDMSSSIDTIPIGSVCTDTSETDTSETDTSETDTSETDTSETDNDPLTDTSETDTSKISPTSPDTNNSIADSTYQIVSIIISFLFVNII